MNMDTYLVEAGRSAAGKFHSDLLPAPVLVDQLIWLQDDSIRQLDAAKKALFYGKVNDLVVGMNMQPALHHGSYLGSHVEEIHAILGILTEAGELADLLRQELTAGPPMTRNDLIDEAGDVLWYLALLFRHLGTTFEEVAEKNITKLRKRFPDKFEEHLAIHKDVEAERQSMFTP